ncbi:FGGY-family carbohydrate kinase [Fusibacter ferrireducens]|uniref:FGGY-family carbohydrate kinase n=1 Tax=Fusibacter ferrireducens TaxID=2785058 RepID=UPI001E5E3141|nr:FGGY-family carbohydrate kinase [Fusibacter ferrireducens]
MRKTKTYDDILASASQVSIDNGLYFLPYLMGERSPHNDADARGVFWGLNMTHDQAAMSRAVLEGVAFGLRDSFEIFSALGQPVEEIRINGGGAQNEFWCQMIADMLNTKVVKLETDAGPAYGAAILAAVGNAVYDSVENACDALIATSISYEPNANSVCLYDEKYKQFAKLYPGLKSLFKEVK